LSRDPGGFVIFVALLAVALITAGCQSPRAASGPGAPPSVPVSVEVAAQEPVPTELHAVGTVDASSIIQIRSQISGELTRVAFMEGGNVNKGDLLFEIDARPYREALRQAEAALARDTAQLRQAEANLARDQAQSKNADADAARYAQLAAQRAASERRTVEHVPLTKVNRKDIVEALYPEPGLWTPADLYTHEHR